MNSGLFEVAEVRVSQSDPRASVGTSVEVPPDRNSDGAGIEALLYKSGMRFTNRSSGSGSVPGLFPSLWEVTTLPSQASGRDRLSASLAYPEDRVPGTQKTGEGVSLGGCPTGAVG